MFSRLPMLAISRGVRKPRPKSMAGAAVRTQIGLVIRGMDRVLIDANTFSAPNLFSAHYASPVRKLVVRRVLMSRISQRSCCCDMNMSGAEVSVLGR
jgi:hypothetical protein